VCSVFSVRCIEEIFKTQRTLCSLLRPSLEILSLRTSVNTSRSELEYRDHVTKKNLSVKLIVKNCDSGRHRSDTLDSESAQQALAQQASHKLKLLTSMCGFSEYCLVGKSNSGCLIYCKWKVSEAQLRITIEK